MAITPQQLRVRIGLQPSDDTRDEDIDAAMLVASELCEAFCDRKFVHGQEVEEIYPARNSLLVKRYPLIAVVAITDSLGDEIDPASYQIIGAAGIILRAGDACAFGCRAPLTVEYEGGYDPLPADLEYAVLGAFDAVWWSSPGWGAAAGGAQQGGLKSISVVGVGSLDYEPGASSVSSSGGAQVGGQPAGILPVAVTSILQRYMNHTVIAGG